MAMEFAYNQILENVQLNNMILAIVGDGVISGLDVSERGAGVNMSVDVATGSALIDGTTYTESSIVNLVISAADATHARKDLVIYDSATSNPLVVPGTPATPPIPPDITAGDILLAIVDIAANETEITNSEITDCIIDVPIASTIGGLLDVVITSITDNEVLAYDSGTSKWINQTPSEAGLAALAGFTMAGNININGKRLLGVPNSPSATSDAVNQFYVDDHNWAATDITSGTLPVARGGTGVTGDTYDADKVDGCHAGTIAGTVWKLPPINVGEIFYGLASAMTGLAAGTNGYQLTTAPASAPWWAAASDLIFSDTHCPKCGQEFQDGDNLILHVIGHNEVGDILTIPMHQSCAAEPKKTVTIQRKIFEDQHALDEATGNLKVQRVQKMQEKTVTRHKLKEGYVLNNKSGKAHKLDKDGKQGKTAYNLSTALETVEETISEVIYEDVEYTL